VKDANIAAESRHLRVSIHLSIHTY